MEVGGLGEGGKEGRRVDEAGDGDTVLMGGEGGCVWADDVCGTEIAEPMWLTNAPVSLVYGRPRM
jgi:hypothetical protein